MSDFTGMLATLGFVAFLIGGIPRMISRMESDSVRSGRRGTIDMKTGNFVKRPREATDDGDDDFEEVERGRIYRARRIRRKL